MCLGRVLISCQPQIMNQNDSLLNFLWLLSTFANVVCRSHPLIHSFIHPFVRHKMAQELFYYVAPVTVLVKFKTPSAIANKYNDINKYVNIMNTVYMNLNSKCVEMFLSTSTKRLNRNCVSKHNFQTRYEKEIQPSITLSCA